MFPVALFLFIVLTTLTMRYTRRREWLSSMVFATMLTIISLAMMPAFDEFLRGRIQNRAALLFLGTCTISGVFVICCAARDIWERRREMDPGQPHSQAHAPTAAELREMVAKTPGDGTEENAV